MNGADFAHCVARALDDATVPYTLSGSLASSIYGRLRSTQDVDFVIDPDERGLRQFVEMLTPERWYVDLHVALDSLRRRSLFNVIHLESGWKADLIVRKERPFSRAEFARRRAVRIADRVLVVASPEDVILAKLEWAKEWQFERQLNDALGIAEVAKDTLDQGYLLEWVAELGLDEQWEWVRQRAGI